ncbi:hypothetical protein [Parabacteroides merdae]|uniref:hypothetical protein n=1 Tax=Parabacteroides merdae TaxID=46503 RepID=UPI00216B4FB2|nr:hypothetical protein [Parabacteroides merdae]
MAGVTTDGIAEVHSASHLSPMSDAKVACGLYGSRKVRRQSRFGQNLSQTSLSVFSPKTLPLLATRLKKHPATETSDWREIRKYRGTAYRRSGILMLHP